MDKLYYDDSATYVVSNVYTIIGNKYVSIPANKTYSMLWSVSACDFKLLPDIFTICLSGTKLNYKIHSVKYFVDHDILIIGREIGQKPIWLYIKLIGVSIAVGVERGAYFNCSNIDYINLLEFVKYDDFDKLHGFINSVI